MKEVIRGHIGFDGLLLSDDLSMQALGGSLAERAARSLAAGCDIALHCNGRMDEMTGIAASTGAMTESGGNAVRGRPFLARPPSRPGRQGRPCRRCRQARDLIAGMGIRRGQILWRCMAPMA